MNGQPLSKVIAQPKVKQNCPDMQNIIQTKSLPKEKCGI